MSSSAACSAVPIAGSIPLFMFGVVLYLFFATAIGIFLGTIARSMPQLGLLYMLVCVPMNMLSGSNTPLESMPPWLATAMQASPSTHFVSFAQAILYRGAGLDVVWPQFALVAGIGGLFFFAAAAALSLQHGTGQLEHDPEKWRPVFGQDHARTNNQDQSIRSRANTKSFIESIAKVKTSVVQRAWR